MKVVEIHLEAQVRVALNVQAGHRQKADVSSIWVQHAGENNHVVERILLIVGRVVETRQIVVESSLELGPQGGIVDRWDPVALCPRKDQEHDPAGSAHKRLLQVLGDMDQLEQNVLFRGRSENFIFILL